MRSYLVAGALCLALLILAGLGRPGLSRAERPEPLTPADLPDAPRSLSRTVGTSGCAGPGCHGQEKPRPDKCIRLDEYRVWNLWDPHAHAYHALEGRQAKRIINQLRRSDTYKEATGEERCLVCHTDPLLAVAEEGEERRLHGVGCESCHGPARDWLEPHRAEPPRRPGELVRLGMRDLSDPTTLASVCVGCHVGAGKSEELPAREVTHDLIAAGHPRLHFELACYLANLPPHWNVQEKLRTRQPGFEARI